MEELLAEYGEHRVIGTLCIVGGTFIIMLLARVVLIPVLRRLARGTDAEVDDQIIDLLSPVVVQSVLLLGLRWAVDHFLPDNDFDRHIASAVGTLLILVWGRFIMRSGTLLFTRLSERPDRFRWIQPQSVPLIQFVFKVLVVGLITYLIMSAWHVNLTSWLASAGVLGIAVGFAAKDTLANFISGVFILVDAPYKVGDIIIIDDVTRGRVQDIGMRSTRLLTTDNIEVTVPNAVIGSAKIVNESSGPSLKMRVRALVGVAYGSDVDRVKEVLAASARDLDFVTGGLEPVVRFDAMGESSLDFSVRVMVDHPRHRAHVLDQLNTRIYKALNEAAIEIPFPQRDLHVKGWPGPPAAGSD